MTDTAPDKISAEEFADSITGHEEIRVAQAFGGVELYDLSPVKLLRALVYVQELRGGAKPHDARETCLGLTLAEVNGRFADEEPDGGIEGLEEPTTAAGKGA